MTDNYIVGMEWFSSQQVGDMKNRIAQLEADKAELVEQIRADRDTFRDCDTIDDPIGAAAQLEAAMRNCDALLEKHGGRDD